MTTFGLAKPEDTDELIAYMQRFYEADHMTFRESVARISLARFFELESAGRIWWILDGEQRIGYIALTFCFSLEFGGISAVVDEIYIEKTYRSRGIGYEALKYVEEFCRSRGILALHLEVDRANLHAQALYRKAGYSDRNNFLLTKWLNQTES